jgi:hypothetical protein
VIQIVSLNESHQECQEGPQNKEDIRLRVFEKKFLKGVLGPKGVRVAEGQRMLHSKEFHN